MPSFASRLLKLSSKRLLKTNLDIISNPDRYSIEGSHALGVLYELGLQQRQEWITSGTNQAIFEASSMEIVISA